MILDDILANKREEILRRRQRVPLAEVRAAASRQRDLAATRRPGIGAEAAGDNAFLRALRAPGVSLIAEAKQRSPSRGILCADYQPSSLAVTYARNGAAAVSVLTDERYFGGELSHLRGICDALALAGLRVPVLRKDFILDAYQVYEACAAGADALLLIVTALSDAEIGRLLFLTHQLGMEALVEVRDAPEVERAVRAGASVVGVNNRDLRDFSVDLATFERLRKQIPAGVVTVAESGIHDGEDVLRLRGVGADAALVGEAIVTSQDTAAAVRDLVRGGRV